MSLFDVTTGRYIKFPDPGTTFTGTVTREAYKKQATKFNSTELDYFDNGDPKMNIILHLETAHREDSDDDGSRILVISSTRMRNAIGEAMRAASARDIEVGGTLTVTFTGFDPQSKNPRNPAKLYTASYVPPASPFAGGQEQPQAPAQQAYAAPQAQPVQQQAAPAQPAAAQVDPWNPGPPPAQTATPATPAPAAVGPDMSKLPALLAAGLDDQQIASALGTTPEVVAQARANAA